jgi:hypothetical protein
VAGFEVNLIDDDEVNDARQFTVQLFDPSPGALLVPPIEAVVEILDDDTPVEPPTIRMPLELGSEWACGATVSYQTEANYDGWLLHTSTVGSLDARVTYKGNDYVRLRFTPTEFASGPQILLRQSGDSLLFICPADTLSSSFFPPPWEEQLHESLPWLLADLSAVRDTTVTLFSGEGEGASDRRTLRIFGRGDTVVPAGPFRQTLHVTYQRELHDPRQMTSLSSAFEFTFADSVGIVRARHASYTIMGGIWESRSWSAELVSYSPGE